MPYPTPPAFAQNLAVQFTWDGAPLPPSQQAKLHFWLEQGSAHLLFSAPFYGDPPPSHPVGSTPHLWEHEVFELFVAGPSSKQAWPYLEMEFGPHGHFLLLQLSSIRNIQKQGLLCSYEAHIQGETWFGYAKVPCEFFPPTPWTWNAYTIHGVQTQRHYHAAFPVQGTQPDFHQPKHFRPLSLQVP